MTPQEIMAKLQEPFPIEDIEFRVGSTSKDKTKGLALAYVTNRAIQARLDEVFGPFGWQNQFREWKNNSQICGISVWCEDRKEWITKWDGADDSQTEAIKGGLSDSMKRAAVQWGIGRYLYNLEGQWCKLRPAGNSYVLDEQPKLPSWALPKGYAPPKATQHTQPQKPATNEVKPTTAPQKQEQQPKSNVNWKPFWASAGNLGFDEDKVHVIAAEIFGKDQISSLNEVVKNQADASKLLNELAKRKRTA